MALIPKTKMKARQELNLQWFYLGVYKITSVDRYKEKEKDRGREKRIWWF